MTPEQHESVFRAGYIAGIESIIANMQEEGKIIISMAEIKVILAVIKQGQGVQGNAD